MKKYALTIDDKLIKEDDNAYTLAKEAKKLTEPGQTARVFNQVELPIEKQCAFTFKNTNTLKCTMIEDCKKPVQYIDTDGYVYCEKHAKQRSKHKSCRQLKWKEVEALNRGETIKYK